MKAVQFLVDEDLPRSTAELVGQFGHRAVDVRDVGLRGERDRQVIAYARKHKLCLITGDHDFADTRSYPPSKHFGIVVLRIRRDSAAGAILDLLKAFLQREDLVVGISGKLAIVEPGRLRIRT